MSLPDTPVQCGPERPVDKSGQHPSTMKKLHLYTCEVSRGSYTMPAAFSVYPEGVELVQGPSLSCDEKSAVLHLTLRCEPEVGKQMGWIPIEKPEATS